MMKESIVAKFTFQGVSDIQKASWCHVTNEIKTRRNLSASSPKEVILESNVWESPTHFYSKRCTPGSHVMQEMAFGGCSGMAGPVFCP
jgi:hypothetical protein